MIHKSFVKQDLKNLKSAKCLNSFQCSRKKKSKLYNLRNTMCPYMHILDTLKMLKFLEYEAALQLFMDASSSKYTFKHFTILSDYALTCFSS